MVGLSALFNPKVLLENSLFIIDSRLIPSGYSNEFYELTNNRIGVHVNSEVIIGGVSRKVLKIMACNRNWINKNYFEPMESYATMQLPAGNNNEECLESNKCCFLDIFFCLFCWYYYLCECGWSTKCKRIIALIFIFAEILYLIIILSL